MWPMELPESQETAIDEICQRYEQKNILPNIAVLGPRFCGKSEFMSKLQARLQGAGARRPIHCFQVDLQGWKLDSEERMVLSFLDKICSAAIDSAIQLDLNALGEVAPNVRLEQALAEIVNKGARSLILFVDHFDSLPRFFARSLSRRFRAMSEQQRTRPEFGKIGVVIGGTMSLFELKQEVDSAFTTFNILPFPLSLSAESIRHRCNGGYPVEVIEAISEESGGEPAFLDALLTQVRKVTANPDDAVVRKCADEVARSSELLIDIAWHSWLDKTIYEFVHKLLLNNELSLRPAADVHRYQLAGVCKVVSDRFVHRNGIVRRFLRALTKSMDGINYSFGIANIMQKYAAHITALPVLERLLRLNILRARFFAAADVSTVLDVVKEAWYLTVEQNNPDIQLFVKAPDGKRSWWLRQASTIAGSEQMMDAAADAVRECLERKRPCFGSDLGRVAFAVPMQSQLRCVLCISVARRDINDEFSEAYLIHWLTWILGSGPVIAAFAGNAIAQQLLLYGTSQPMPTNSQSEKAPRTSKHRMFIVPTSGLIGIGGGHLYHSRGDIDPAEMDDLNNRCLELPAHIGGEDFEPKLRGISTQVRRLLDELSGFEPALERMSDDERLEIISDVEGLKIPFELYPFRDSYLYLHRPVVRRVITQAGVPSEVRLPFSALLERLKVTQQELRVLILASDPYEELQNVDVEAELVEKSLRQGCQKIRINCAVVVLHTDKNVDDLRQALDTKHPFHIFHYCGHSQHGAAAEGSALLVRAKDNSASSLTAKQIRQWFERKGIAFAFLNSCEGGTVKGTKSVLGQRYLSLIETLLAAGIPNILTYRCAVSNLAVREMACQFYDHLFACGPGDLSHALFCARRDVEAIPDSRDAGVFSIFVSQLP
jgi:hypothetical protein